MTLPIALLALLPAAAHGAEVKAPAWKLEVIPTPTNFAPDTNVEGFYPGYTVLATNIGGEASSGPVVITTTLPDGLNPGLRPPAGRQEFTNPVSFACDTVSRTISCTTSRPVSPGAAVYAEFPVAVEDLPDPSTVTVEGTIEGGGAAAVSAAREITVSAALPEFGFMPGATEPNASFSAADATTVTQAGAHPYQLTINGNFTTYRTGFINNAGGTLRDINFELPPGVIINPNATAQCTMAQLETNSCPPASQIGMIQPRVATTGFSPVGSSLYNMVPPPGVASDFAFIVVQNYFHILGEVKPGDYGAGNYTLASQTKSLPSVLGIIGMQVQFWGDPSSSSHELVRGGAGSPCEPAAPCPVEPESTSLLSVPTSCPSTLPASASIDSWQDIGNFVTSHGVFQDLSGTPTGVSGCAAVEFNPTLKARPTTSVADSPTGFEADVGIPQQEKLGTLAQADLKDMEVTLPKGISVSPSAANGLGACSPAQIGVSAATGVPNGAQPTCPGSSKVGTIEVDTPLLGHPLPGQVYLATPYENPFNSLMAFYAVINDPISGSLLKLPARVRLDQATGQITTIFDNSPQFPFTHFKLRFFAGAGATLRTPAVCGRYATTSVAKPWSGNPPAHPSDEYEISASANGGPCPTTSGAEPNSPSVDAGTATPLAGTYSSFVFNLRREDGSQEITKVSLTAPPGLTGRLAGIPYCPDSALVAARGRSGREEQATPSCPQASELGTVTAGAGPGPTPYYAKGTAYLAGPYEGAPLSMVFVTPAVAGPFDLGTIVVRSALRINPVSGQITSTTDEIPHILDGIPLDIRSIELKLDRSQFIRNGTSCNPFSLTGSALSALGQSASFSEHFQLGECLALPFKPKLSLRLSGGTKRGGHPALRGVLTMPEGGANLAGASVALPHSEFLDQSHIGTVCTRVQFAEGNGNGERCPAASVYGHAVATSPLVDYPVEGPVFLRSSSHKLPDLVMALHGPASQPIAFEAVARIDSVRGGIRSSFEDTPDLPISRVVLWMAGGKKGLLENSTNICRGARRATAELTGQNGKALQLRPMLRNSRCKGVKHPKQKRHAGHRRGRAAR